MDDVFDYVKDHTVCTEEEYKYTARDGKCKDDKCTLNLGVKGRINVESGSVDALLEAAEHSPLVVAIDASPMSFYRGGVLKLNHLLSITELLWLDTILMPRLLTLLSETPGEKDGD